MGKRIGIVVISTLFVIFAVAVFGFPTPVNAQYPTNTPVPTATPVPTPTPTPPVGSCTGYADCTVVPGACGGSCDPCESYSYTKCKNPATKLYEICNGPSCSNNTACPSCSIPPAGCPDPRVGCNWSGANDCGGGICGCGERRTGTLWCVDNSIHCDDICTSNQTCTVGCNNPTPEPTQTPGGPTATPTPTPPVTCPNGTCDAGEDCLNCPADCVCPPTPTPLPGTIQVRAMQVSAGDTSCTAVRNSPTGVDGTVHQFTPSSASHPSPLTQSGSSYVVFNSLDPGLYGIYSQAPAQYLLVRLCWSKAVSGTSGEGRYETLASMDTLTWDLGYTLGTAWSQAQGGDVYASASLQSYVPAGATPRAAVREPWFSAPMMRSRCSPFSPLC